MVNNPTVAAEASTTEEISGTYARIRSGGIDGNSICAQDRFGLARFALRDGLWERNDLLAEVARLATSRGVGKTPPRIVAPLTGGRAHRLVARRSRFEQCACGFWGLQTGPNPTDRRKAGSKHHLCTDAQ